MNKLLRSPYLIAFALAVITIVAYCQVFGNGFVNFDDTKYVYENSRVRSGLSGSGIVWALTTGTASNWHPLTWISHMADVSLYGLRPAGHHATNLILHVLNVLLLFVVLLRLIGHNPQSQVRNPKSEIQNPVVPSPAPPLSPSSLWRCAFVAALFAVHPLHVESVAWIAERKDVLSTFLFLLTILAYVRYVRMPGIARYMPVVVLFALGLMAKPMLVTLPFVLLLLDYWPLGRFGVSREGEVPVVGGYRSSLLRSGPRGGTTARQEPRPPDGRKREADTRSSKSRSKSKSTSATGKSLVLEKAPLFLLAGVSCIITYHVQQAGGAVSALDHLPLGVRISNAFVAYAAYMWKMVWPTGLSILYPYPAQGWPVWQVAVAAFVLIAVTLAVYRFGARRPYLLVGWLWYVGTLVPVIGLVQVGAQSMADRYTYVPLIGLFLVIAWGVPEPVTREPIPNTQHPTPTLLLALAVIAVLSALTWRQVGYWRNGITLFEHAIAVTKDNAVAHQNLGVAFANVGRDREATAHYARAAEINPNSAENFYNLGLAAVEAGDLAEAEEQFSKAVEMDPNYAKARNNLANVLVRQGRNDEAVREYQEALRIDPDYVEAHCNLGNQLYRQGDTTGAADHFEAALRADRRSTQAHVGLANILIQDNAPDEAVDHLNQALSIKPDLAEAHYALANLLLMQRKVDDAVEEYRQVLKIRPDDAEAHCNLGLALRSRGDLDGAMRELTEAVRLRPDLGPAHYNLAMVLHARGDYAGAWTEIHAAEKAGVRPHPEFVKVLSQKMPDPGR